MNVVVYSTGSGCAVVSPAPGVSIDDAIARAVPQGAARVTVASSALPSGPVETWQIVDGVLSASPAATAAYLQSYAASVRYAKETGGITIAGRPVATDRESQGLITGASALLQADPSIPSVNFKGPSGFVVIDRADFIAMAQIIGIYVQASFTAEGKIDVGITSGAITTTSQIDASQYWPSTTL
jgi:hypothetical protein